LSHKRYNNKRFIINKDSWLNKPYDLERHHIRWNGLLLKVVGCSFSRGVLRTIGRFLLIRELVLNIDNGGTLLVRLVVTGTLTKLILAVLGSIDDVISFELLVNLLTVIVSTKGVLICVTSVFVSIVVTLGAFSIELLPVPEYTRLT
jgi:hypothetical protein